VRTRSNIGLLPHSRPKRFRFEHRKYIIFEIIKKEKHFFLNIDFGFYSFILLCLYAKAMRILLLSTIFITFCSISFGQKSFGGFPLGLINSEIKDDISKSSNKTIVPSLDKKEIDAFDRRSSGIQRFAAPVKVSFDLENSGQWRELKNGGRLWTLHLQTEEAKGMVISYEKFELPIGGRFFMYSVDGKQVKGAYTHKNNQKSGKFLTGMLKGNEAVLEYYEPALQKGKAIISIDRIYQIYNPDEAFSNKYPFKVKSTVMDTGFGASLECEININCPLGDDYQDEKRGIVRIMMVLEEGLGWCSGSLMNNTAENARLFILTAFHCQDGYTPYYDQWRFDFNYEGAGCNNPSEEPGPHTFIGCEYKAGYQNSDFLLLELTADNIPASVDAYFNGWNRDETYEPAGGTIIHHPSGDIKKVSRDEHTVTIFPFEIEWNTGVTTPAFHHFRAILDEGTMEGGSSGCPLFDSNGHVVGQLNGGIADCEIGITYHGRIAKSWAETGDSIFRLKDWLDPMNINVLSWDGMENPVAEVVKLSGYIKTNLLLGMGNVKLTLEGPGTMMETFTDTTGYYEFNDVVIGQSYTITPEKDMNAANGISALDLLLVQKHVLGKDLLDDAYKVIAADANNSNSTTGIDLVQIQKVNLGIDEEFANRPAWIFEPPVLEVSNVFNDAQLNDVLGNKIGDVNDSANPHE
jgi:hypothetical protein